MARVEHNDVFKQLDTDGNGNISKEEFEAAYGKKVVAGPDMASYDARSAPSRTSKGPKQSPKPGTPC